MMALSETKAGESYTVKWMFGLPGVLNFLRDRHMEEGSTVKVIQKLSGGVIVRAGNFRIAIDADTAKRIKV